jgi:hypothetical protein
MSTARSNHGAGVVGELLYAVGGMSSTGAPLQTAEKYDIARNRWDPIAPMGVARRGLRVATLDNTLYALGSDSDDSNTLCERYDPTADAWTVCSDMSVGRAYFGAVGLNGTVYAVGPTKSEKYNTATKTWSPIADLNSFRTYFGIAAVKDKLYVVGGYDGVAGSSVEVYIPDTNAWTFVPDMSKPRCHVSAAAMDGKLYVVGGTSCGMPTADIYADGEVYDPDTNEWTAIASVPGSGLADTGLGVVPNGGKTRLLSTGGYNVVKTKTSTNSVLQFEGLCTPFNVTAKWVVLASSPGPQTYSTTTGMSRTYSVTNAHTWGQSTTRTASAGFSAFGLSASVSVSGTASISIANTYSTNFELTKTATYSTVLPKGQVWQWQMTVEDSCGTSILMTKDLRVTVNVASPPCCLVGFENNITNPHSGGCVAAPGDTTVYNLCA